METTEIISTLWGISPDLFNKIKILRLNRSLNDLYRACATPPSPHTPTSPKVRNDTFGWNGQSGKQTWATRCPVKCRLQGDERSESVFTPPWLQLKCISWRRPRALYILSFLPGCCTCVLQRRWLANVLGSSKIPQLGSSSEENTDAHACLKRGVNFYTGPPEPKVN